MGLEADSEGFTALAFQDQQPAGAATRPGDETLLVKFYSRTMPDEAESKKQGRPCFHDVEYISIMVPGNKSSMIDDPANDLHRQRFPQHYAAFKNRVEEQVEGMPLTEWPGVTRSQAEELSYFNVKTVEQLATLSDTNAQGMMGLPLLRERAKAYLNDVKDNAATEKLAHQLRERDEKIAGLETTISEMSQAIEELKKANDVPVGERHSESGRRRGGTKRGE